MSNTEASTLLVPIRNDYQHLAETEQNEIAVALYKAYVNALNVAIAVLETDGK